MRKNFLREQTAKVEIVVIGLETRENARIIGRIHDSSDCGKVFRRRAKHRWTADVDVFDHFFSGGASSSSDCFEWIEIHSEK